MDNYSSYNQAPAKDPRKSKMTAGLFGIFLGLFGVHNFYLGYKGKAITQVVVSSVSILLQLINYILFFVLVWVGVGVIFYFIAVLCWLPMFGMQIWGLVEGILILSGKINTDAKGGSLRD